MTDAFLAHSWWLLLLAALVVPILAARRSRAAATGGRRGTALALHLLAIALVVVALAEPWHPGAPATVRVAVDALPGGATPWSSWRAASPAGERFHVVPAPDNGGLPAALDRALALANPDAHLEVAVFGPARGRRRELAPHLDALSRRGARLHWRRDGTPPPLAVPAAAAPPRVHRHEPFPVTVTVQSPTAGPATVEVRGNDGLWGRTEVALRPGRHRYPVDALPRGAGAHALDVVVTAGDRTATQHTAVLVEGALPVSWLGTEATVDAARRTLAPHGIEVLPATGGVPATAHAVVVEDLPAGAWPEEHQRDVARRVPAEGLGLLLAGTEGNLGPGGYAGSPLAPLLPVELPAREERRDPSVALVIIIDTSGSMGGNRVELAKEVARLAVRRLMPHDKVGIVEFYGSKRWAAPLQPAANTIELMRALNRLQAGGGTVIYSSLEEAYYALLDVRTRFRHVLVLTDGGVESGPFEALARRMADNGINLNTVLIGPQGNSPFLLDLAHWGRGRFYACPNRFQLPELRFKQPQNTPLPAVHEGRTPVTRTTPAEATTALAGDDAAVLGTVEATPRPAAEVLLRAGERPLLVAWDQGAGRSAVLTSDLHGPRAGPLRRHGRYGAFLADLLRSLARGHQARSGALTVHAAPGHLDVEVPAAAPSTAVVLERGGTTVRWPTTRRANGRRGARVPWPGGGGPVVVTAGDRRGAARPPRTGTTTAGDALTAMVAATGGTTGSVDAPVQRDDERPASRPAWRSLVPWLALGALGLWLLSVLVRRWPAAAGILLAAVATVPATAQDGDPWQRIREERRRVGHLEALAEEWKDASPAHRVALHRARGELAAAVEAMGDDPATATDKVLLLDALGRREEALAALRTVLGDDPPPRRRAAWSVQRFELLLPEDRGGGVLRRGARVLGDDPATRRAFGHLAGHHGLHDLALELHTTEGLTGKDAMHVALRRALWHARAGDVDGARRALETAYDHAPLTRDRDFVLALLVARMRTAGRLDELADEWRALDESDPPRRRALLSVLRELGRGDEALDLLDRWGPAAGALQEQAMAIAAEDGDVDEALRRGRRQLAGRPGDARLRLALAVLLVDADRRPEADALMHEGMDRAGRQDLLRLVRGAGELVLTGAFDHGLGRLAAGDDDDRLQAVLLEVRFLRDRGRLERAVERLRAAADDFDDPGHRVAIAEALESAGRTEDALPLYRDAWEETRTEDVGLRLAWLLGRSDEEAHQEEAFELFRKVWLQAGSEARRVQAEERVLDLAARQGRLAELAIELEETLDDPEAPHRDTVREALVKIYTRARDSLSAAVLLRQWAEEEPGHAVEAYRRLARVHLENEEFHAFERVVRELIELDPEGELEYLQQLAMSALERGRPDRAHAVLEEMLAMGGDHQAVAWEFAAGIYSLAGAYEEAVRVYEQSLARHPDRIETLLLWGNAMASLDRRDRAIGRFRDLLLRDVRDDLFLVAVDGLLNLSAPPEALRFAARRLRRRLAHDPDEVYLHRALQDVLEELGEEEARLASLEETVRVAGEQRPTWLRELMNEARARRDMAAYLRHGRALLATGAEIPPSVFLELGEAMLGADDLHGAERAFARARLSPDFAAVERRIAELYEERGLWADAERVRRRILRRTPEDPDALLGVARLAERRGLEERALELYRRAATLLLTRGADLSAGPRRRGRNVRSDAGGETWTVALAGLLRTATGRADVAPLLAEAEAALLPDPPGDGGRALVLLDLLRRAALAFGGPADLERLAAAEAAVLAAHDDEEVREDIAGNRRALGDVAGARAALGEVSGFDLDQLQLALLAGDHGAAATLVGAAPPDQAYRVIQVLLVAGRRDLAATMLAALEDAVEREPDRHGRDWLRAAPLLGREIDEVALHDRILAHALADTGGSVSQRVAGITGAVTRHPDLDPSRARNALGELVGPVLAEDDPNLARRLLRAAHGVLPVEDLEPLVAMIYAQPRRAYDITNNARFLEGLDPERITGLVSRGLRRFSSQEQRQQLLRLVGNDALPAAARTALVDDLDLGSLTPAERHWFTRLCLDTKLPPSLAGAFLAHLEEARPRDARTAVLAARLAEDPEERRRHLRRALELLDEKRELDSYDLRVIRTMAGLTGEAFAGELRDAEAEGLAGRWLRAELAELAGRHGESADLLLEIQRQRPEDTSLLNVVTQRLEKTGRTAEAVKAYERHLQSAARVYPYQAGEFARLYLTEGRPADALDVLRAADDQYGRNLGLMLRAALAFDDPADRRQAARGWLQERIRLLTSRPGRVISFSAVRRGTDALHPDALTRPPELPRPAPREPAAATEEEDLLAFLPEGAALARRMLRALPVTARAAHGALYRGLVGSVHRHGDGGALRDRAVQRARARGADGEAWRVLVAAAQVGLEVPGDLLRRALRHRLIGRSPGDEEVFAALCTAWHAGHRDLALEVLEVLLADRTTVDGYRLREHLPALFAFAARERREALWRLVPGPEGNVHTYLDPALLLALRDGEAARLREAFAGIPELVRSRSPYHGAMRLVLPYAGVLLRTGERERAQDLLMVEDSALEDVSAPEPTALLAAVPPLERWPDGAEAAAFGDFLLEQAARGSTGRRQLFLQLGAVLMWRWRAAGEVAAAEDFEARWSGLAGVLPHREGWRTLGAER